MPKSKNPPKAQISVTEIYSLLMDLRQNPPLNALDDELISSLSKIARPRLINKHEIIFHQGDDARSVFLVVKGEIRVFLSEPSGKERTLKIASKGELFGEAAVFQKDGYPASSVPLKKALVLEFPKASLIELISLHPELAFATIGVLSARLKELTALIEGSLKEVEPRLASYLLSLPEKHGHIKLPISKVELSRLLGTSPESLSRALSGLRGLKLIEVNGPSISILDRSALEERSFL
jgi:CRP/FNR family transcriptional regulator